MSGLSEPARRHRPDDVEVAVQILSSRLSNEIVRFLKDHPTSSSQEIVEATGSTRNAVAGQLKVLEDAGVVHGIPERGHRRGHSARYRVNHQALQVLLDAWLAYVTGGSPTTT
ncbi:helix-turn-helix transcriptional regulator [Oerskovia sp. Root22]|uniref:ArsR/SmtB family transcription factor n=1 Tax=Oerskovia sp. Root22 TaxID=1736494 RepID=UPI0012FA1627|nr:winged helix-turn-helix domain-containing protein [Oerskovia sp. Root22]